MDFKSNSLDIKYLNGISVRERVNILLRNNNNLSFYDQKNWNTFSECIADIVIWYILNVEYCNKNAMKLK